MTYLISKLNLGILTSHFSAGLTSYKMFLDTWWIRGLGITEICKIFSFSACHEWGLFMCALPLLCPINISHKNVNLVTRQPTLLDVLDLYLHINRIIRFVSSGIGLVKCACIVSSRVSWSEEDILKKMFRVYCFHKYNWLRLLLTNCTSRTNLYIVYRHCVNSTAH